MATENATERHTTANEEETTVAMNCQSDDSNNNGSDNSGSYDSLEDKLGYYYIRGGARKGLDERDPNYIPEEEVW
jgi:hypothetical protein